MLLKDFIRTSKAVTDAGGWTDKKMSKNPSRFPLWKPKGKKLGLAWRWRVVEFAMNDNTAQSRVGRMLIAFRQDKQEYLAYVGIDELVGNGVLVIGCLEFHGTHVGWHVHGACLPASPGCVGRERHEAMRRLPRGGRLHRRTDFVTNEDEALLVAEEFFNFQGLSPVQTQTKLDFGS